MRRLIAASLGLGFIPRRLWRSDTGAGTFGAALAAGIGGFLLWVGAHWWVSLAVAASLVGLSLWASRPYADGDPGWVCIDETAGTLVALIGLSGVPWLVALVAARSLDIFKVVPGIRAAERLPGPWGITGDDVVAGLYGLGAGWLAVAVL